MTRITPAQPVHRTCTTCAQAAYADDKGKTGAALAMSVLLIFLALAGCSPGGVVAGTVGAAGAVAGAAVDVVLRSDVNLGGPE